MHYMIYGMPMHYDVSFNTTFDYNDYCNTSQAILLLDNNYRQTLLAIVENVAKCKNNFWW